MRSTDSTRPRRAGSSSSAIGIGNGALCVRFVDPALAETIPRFEESPAQADSARLEALVEALSARLGAQTADFWQQRLLPARVPAVRADGIDHAEFMLEHPHCRENGVAVLAEQPGTPLSARAGSAIEFSEHPTPIAPAAELGAETEEILASLGYSPTEISDFEARGITRALGNELPV